ncbi:hypothetical protein Vafri_4512 [Volvox africanus]|uniref:Uncharacterized protein n=1 Tax=Volvox africanus TaxID=51714 RepID=A0A8J4ATZ2_9CHLO|nr:hypothetical protein Vafri_4512 [Volvox africanus]
MSAALILALQQEQRRRQLVLKLSIDATSGRRHGQTDSQGQTQASCHGQELNSREDRSSGPAVATFLSVSQCRARAALQRRKPIAMFLDAHCRHQLSWRLPGPHPAGRRWRKARLWGVAAVAGQVRDTGEDITAGSPLEGSERTAIPGPPRVGHCPLNHANLPTCSPVTDLGPSKSSPPYGARGEASDVVAPLRYEDVGRGAGSVSNIVDGVPRHGVGEPSSSPEGTAHRGIDAADWRDFCIRNAALCTRMVALEEKLNVIPAAVGRDGVARGGGGIAPSLPAGNLQEANLMQPVWARDLWDLIMDVDEYLDAINAQKDFPDVHENLKRFKAGMQQRAAKAEVQAQLDGKRIASYFAQDPYIVLADQMLQHNTVRAKSLVPHLERCFARRPAVPEEATAAGGNGGGGGGGGQQQQQAPAREWLQFGERWRKLLAHVDKCDNQTEEVARMAVRGFLLLVAQQQGRFVANADPLECAGLWFCCHFAERVLGVTADTRRLFTAIRVGYIPHVEWCKSVIDSIPLRGSSRFYFKNLYSLTFRAVFQPLVVDAWAQWARALASGVEEHVQSAVEEVQSAELYYALLRLDGDKDPYLGMQLEFGWDVEQLWAYKTMQACRTSVNISGHNRDDGDDADPAHKPPLPLLALDLLNDLRDMTELMRSAQSNEDAGGGGSAASTAYADFGPLPPILDFEMDSLEQALVLLMWTWRCAETDGVVVCQPAVVMAAPLPAAAGAASSESPQRIELLACAHWQPLPRKGDAGYKWGWIKERIPLITATSNLGLHVKMILDVLLKKRLMLMWIQSKGVEGLRRMMLALSQARREMLEAGRDFCLSCTVVLSWGNDEPGSDEDGDGGGERGVGVAHAGSDGGPSGCRDESPLQHGCKAKTAKGRCGLTAAQLAAKDAVVQLDNRLRAHIAKSELAPARGHLVDDDQQQQQQSSFKNYQEAHRLTEQLLGMMMDGVPGIRDGIVLEFMILECPPERPWETVRPEVPKHVRHQQEKRRSIQRQSEFLR